MLTSTRRSSLRSLALLFRFYHLDRLAITFVSPCSLSLDLTFELRSHTTAAVTISLARLSLLLLARLGAATVSMCTLPCHHPDSAKLKRSSISQKNEGCSRVCTGASCRSFSMVRG